MSNGLEQNVYNTAGRSMCLDPGVAVRGLSPGQRLFQRYILRQLLGRGGMGVVWLAQDEKLDRTVALKFLPEILFLDPAARDDLKRETRRSLELTHPNIVRIYDFLEDDDAAAISMEYVDGPTLSRMRVEHSARVFEPEEIKPWLGGLCAALDYAHGDARMVHRDLKPANLMLTSRGILKVTDFGIACSLGASVRVSQWSSSSGTLVYMSPQQMRGDLPSHLDDIYALGATIYEMLTGKPPFYTGDIAMQVREVTPEPMARRRLRTIPDSGSILPAWEETVAACLAKEPSARPQSAGEVMRRLQGCPAWEPSSLVENPAFETMALTQAATRPASPKAPVPSAPKLPAHSSPKPVSPFDRAISMFQASPRAVAVAAIVCGIVLLVAAWPRKSPVASVAAPAVPQAPIPSPVEPPPVAARGGLMIKTSPPGATVELGGEAIETAPAAFKAITPGDYPLKITLSGYDSLQMNARINPGEFTDLGTVKLQRSSGTLQVTSFPEGADYELKGNSGTDARSGKTPDTIAGLPTGVYAIAFKRAGWPDQAQTVEVTRGAVLQAEAKFPAGTLAVNTLPEGANVYFGDRLLGATPLVADLPPGNYENMQVVLDGFIPVNISAEVREGETAAPAPVQLQKLTTALQLTSIPSGLEYSVSGTGEPIRTGTTPAALFDLPAGDYSVTLKRTGWPDFSTPVKIEEQKPVTVDHAFQEGTIAVTSVPDGAQIFLGDRLLGVAPTTIALPPGSTELVAKLEGMPVRKRTLTVADGEETSVAFNMKSGGSSSSHHRRHLQKPTPSALAKIGNSIKAFFAGGAPASPPKPHRPND